MNISINYFNTEYRKTPFNLAIIRIILSSYLIWRVIFFDWEFYSEWPAHRLELHSYLFNDLLLSLLPYQQWVVILLLMLFAIGYRIKWTGGFAALLLLYMMSVRASIYMSAQTESFFTLVYILFIFSFFSDNNDDILSIDGFLQTKNYSNKKIEQMLDNKKRKNYRMEGAKWSLIVVGFSYFSAASAKIMGSPIDRWLSATSIQRDTIRFEIWAGTDQILTFLAMNYSSIAWLSEISNFLLQISFLIVILLGLRISLHVVGLSLIHIGIGLILGYWAISLIFALMLFLSWDAVYQLIAQTEENEITTVYNGENNLLLRILYIIKHLDINNSVNFCNGEKFDAGDYTELSVVRNGQTYTGYWATLELLRQFRIFYPIIQLLSLPVVASFGDYLYQFYIFGSN